MQSSSDVDLVRAALTLGDSRAEYIGELLVYRDAFTALMRIEERLAALAPLSADEAAKMAECFDGATKE